MIDQVLYLDVSDLPAPEPLERILSLLEQVATDQIICMIHRQIPYALFPILKKRDYENVFVERSGVVRVFIWYNGNQEALSKVQKIIIEESSHVC
jgi:hypothetical protein